MKTCPFCGSLVKAEDIFCNQCGKSLQKTCLNCGEQVEVNAAYCHECGFELNKSTSEEREVPATTPIVPVYKKWWFWLVAAAAVIGLILLFSTGGSREDSSVSEAPEEAVSESVDPDISDRPIREEWENEIVDEAKAEEIAVFQATVDEAIEEAFPKPSESQKTSQSDEKTEPMDIKTFQKTMDDVLEDAFGKGCFETDLDQEKKLYNVYVWMDGGKEALKTAQNGDEEDLAYWNARIGLLLETSKKIKEKLDSSGLSDWSVTLSLLDEDAHSDIYAITKDGFIYYEIIKDGELET